ncbi:MAG: T9SS type A sorting domain-containing protein [Bacteroidia bacterium]|nr:T9SS type A sorting domain-containing protein [Bacteroidia bacterium]
MKKAVFTSIFSLVLAALQLASLSLLAGNETKWTRPVQINLDEATLQSQPDIINLTIQIEKPVGVQDFTIVPIDANPFIEIVHPPRTGGKKDGKIDVDIIIRRGAWIASNKDDVDWTVSSVSLSAFKVEFITVDNISGVTVSNEIPGNYMGSARITGISFDDKPVQPASPQTSVGFGKLASTVLKNNELSNAQSNSITAASSQLRIFPMPVRDGLLNIEIPAELNVASLSIHNALGAVVRTLNASSMTGIITISVQDIESGVYFLRVQSKDGRQEIVKRFFIRN